MGKQPAPDKNKAKEKKQTKQNKTRYEICFVKSIL